MKPNPNMPTHNDDSITLKRDAMFSTVVAGADNTNQSAVNGDYKGVSSGSVECCFPSKDDRVAPKKGDDTPGGGW